MYHAVSGRGQLKVSAEKGWGFAAGELRRRAFGLPLTSRRRLLIQVYLPLSARGPPFALTVLPLFCGRGSPVVSQELKRKFNFLLMLTCSEAGAGRSLKGAAGSLASVEMFLQSYSVCGPLFFFDGV